MKKSIAVITILLMSVMLIFASGNSEDQSTRTIRVLLNAHPWQEAIEPLLDDFTAQTGIEVELTVLGEDVYWDRVTLGLSSDEPPFDVFMLSPNQTGFVAYQNGWIAALDDYVGQNPDYDFGDIYPYVVDGFRYPDTSGHIYGIPLTMEVYMMFYRKDLLAEQGIDAASLKTLDDWMEVLEKLDQAYSDQGISAAVIRGQDPTMPDELLAAVANHWGDRPFIPQRMFYFDENWNTRFTDPDIVAGFEDWAKILSYGPVGSEAFTWYDCTTAFASGAAATYWFDASLFASTFEDPEQSVIVGNVGYLPVPPTETGHATTHWGWGLAIPEKSPVKDDAWAFVEWATSKGIETQTAPQTYGPVRASTWVEMEPVFGEEFSSAASEALSISIPGYMYFDGAREVCDRIIDAVIAMSKGADSAATMETLDKQAQEIVQKYNLQ